MLTLFRKQNGHISSSGAAQTFDKALDDWLEYTSGRVKRSTLSTYRAVAERYIRPGLGALYTGALTGETTTKFLENASADYAPATVRIICHVLRSAVAHAQESGRCPAAEARIAPPRGERREARVLSAEEQLRLVSWLSGCDGPAEFGILLCMATGIRLGEACGLRWGDIPAGRYIIYIRRTLQRLPSREGGARTALVFDTPKSASSARTVPVPASLRGRLDELRRGDDCYILTGSESPMEPRRFQSRFKAALRAAGVQDINFHALRHTFATNCVSLGCDAATLARILGHSDVAITLNTYVHPSFEAMRDIVDKNSARFPS